MARKGVMTMGKPSQRKGAEGERELARILGAHGYATRRGGGMYGSSPDVVGLPGIHCEVKRVEALNVSKAMAQSIRDAPEGETPVLFHRKNREPWLVTMRLSDWLPLYSLSDET